MRLLRHPLLHFLLVGVLLNVAQPWLPGDETRSIVVGSTDLERLRADWLRDTARAPTEAELQLSLQRHVDEELLLQEALRLGLDATDPVARERLVGNLRFAFPDTAASDDHLLTQARALGMHRRDFVMRRRLVQLMEMRLVGAATVGEGELRQYVQSHPGRYARPARYRFRHVYFDGRNRDSLARAQARLAHLRAGAVGAETADPFLAGHAFASRTASEVTRDFGPDFAQALAQAPVGDWSGPHASVYGLHLLKLEHIDPARPLPFDEIRARAAYAYLAEREKDLLREAVLRLRSRYRIVLPVNDGSAGATS